MGDRRSESVNRSLTVSPRHAPLTRGLNIKPRPFLGWAARFLSLLLPSLPFSSRAFASSTRQRWRTGTCTTSPLSIFDRVKQTATGSHLYRDNSCNFGGSSSMWNVVPRRTRKCSDCRRVVGWLHGAASSRDRDLLRKLGPLVLLLDRHPAPSPPLRSPCWICFVIAKDWKEQFFRNSFFFPRSLDGPGVL